MKSFRKIIDLWPRRVDIAADLGVTPIHINSMLTRNSIPPQYWSRAVAGAAARGIAGVTLATLNAAATLRAGGIITTRTEDGSVIAVDPETGLSASGGTIEEAVAELRRLLEAAREAA